jgi:hypothetical protein
VLCIAVRLQHGARSLRPGSKPAYAVWVWSPTGVRHVTVVPRLTAPSAVGPARFTVCPAARHGSCSIASLPANQAFELLLSVPVGSSAAAGRYVTVNVVAQAPGVSPAQATVSTAVTLSTQPPASTPPATPAATIPPVPAPAPVPPPSTITPASLPPLFPTVTPSASPVSKHRDPHPPRRAHATLTSATLPLNLRLIGGQLAGLTVLAAAIIMVIARLSLRAPRQAAGGARDQRPAGETPGAPDRPDAP